jgi:hypothetical protein
LIIDIENIIQFIIFLFFTISLWYQSNFFEDLFPHLHSLHLLHPLHQFFIFLAMAENTNPTSEMDSSNPFFLRHGDNPGAMLVLKPLNSENYNSWKKKR